LGVSAHHRIPSPRPASNTWKLPRDMIQGQFVYLILQTSCYLRFAVALDKDNHQEFVTVVVTANWTFQLQLTQLVFQYTMTPVSCLQVTT